MRIQLIFKNIFVVCTGMRNKCSELIGINDLDIKLLKISYLSKFTKSCFLNIDKMIKIISKKLFNHFPH